MRNGNSYLHLAAETGQIEAFKTAFSREDDKDIKNRCGKTSFHLACKNGHLNIVEYLLENTNLNVDINAKDSNSWTGFILASENGYSNVARLLMEKSVILGIDLNAIGVPKNATAFMWACNRGHSNIVKLMIEYKLDNLGIDFNTNNGNGFLAFIIACSNGLHIK